MELLDGSAHISGSFWVSINAAIGIPKFEAGPQKSGDRQHVSAAPKSGHNGMRQALIGIRATLQKY